MIPAPLVITGGLYGDARPDRTWVCCRRGLVPLLLNGKEIPLAPNGDNVLFPRLAPTGERFAGQGSQQHSRSTWEWDGSSWTDRGFGPGTLPVIYDRAGNLHIAAAERETSQGYRYVSPTGELVFGDHTMAIYAPAGPEKPFRLLHEYTVIADRFLIGQDHDSGAHVVDLDTQRRYVLTPGHARFILAQYDRGRDVVAITVCRFDLEAVLFYWCALSDLTTLPEFQSVIDPPPPPPPPPPEDTVTLPRPVWNMLNAVRAKFGSLDAKLTDRQRGQIFNETAMQFPKSGPGAVGMQRKESGTSAELPDGTRVWNGLRWIDQDGKHWGFDVCGACTAGFMRPVDAEGGSADPASFVEWIRDDGDDEEPPPDDKLVERVVKLELRATNVDGAVANLDGRLKNLEANQPPAGGLTVAEVRAICMDVIAGHQASGNTGKAFGHGHSVTLPLVKK